MTVSVQVVCLGRAIRRREKHTTPALPDELCGNQHNGGWQILGAMRSMPVPVMRIRKMRVRVLQRLVRVRVAVSGFWR
jgi:hypothetical protein